jgi:hypothetical protein
VKVHCGEGVAIHTGPESCVDDPRGRGEALTGDRTAQPLSHESLFQGAPTPSRQRKPTLRATSSRAARRPRAVCDPGMCGRSLRGNREISRLTAGYACGPHREGMEP